MPMAKAESWPVYRRGRGGLRRISQKQEPNPARPMTTTPTATHIDQVMVGPPSPRIMLGLTKRIQGCPRSRSMRCRRARAKKKPALATDPERDLKSESATPKLTEEGKGSRQPATGPQSYRGGPQGRCEPVPTTQFVQGCFVKAVSNCAPLALTEAERRPAGFRRAHIWQAASGRARV